MIYIVLVINLLFGADSKSLLDDLYNNDNWLEYSKTDDGKVIYEYQYNHKKYIKVVKEVEYSSFEIINEIKSINRYNEIISNKNVNTKLILQDSDTLYAFQRISNSIPFVRDRQYIFKMYHVDNKRIDWYLLDKNNPLFEEYIDDDVHTLTYGAGSWYIDSNNLINRIYVDDEVNFPASFLHKIRVNNVISIFDDVLNSIHKRRNK